MLCENPARVDGHLEVMGCVVKWDMGLRSSVWIALIWLVAGVRLPGATHGTRGVEETARPRVVGYFPQWGLYDDHRFLVKALMTSGSTKVLDQLNYAQGSVAGGHCSIADRNADLNVAFKADETVDGRADAQGSKFKGYFHQLEELKKRSPMLKMLISLEGKASDFAEDARPENRERFVASCVDLFLRGNFGGGVRRPKLFDGIDLDWEYPKAEDAENFIALLKEMRRQMDAVRPGLRLTIAVGPSPRMYGGTDMGEVAKLVDEVGVMNYDYIGPWSKTTGLLAPLLGDPTMGGTVERSLGAYRNAGVPRNKLLMGMPFYGYGWSGVGEGNHGLYQEGKGIRGDRPYWYIEALGGDFERYRDENSGAPWLFDGKTFWTYDDPISAERKARFARDQELGGVMIWELSGDTGTGDLLKAVKRGVDGVDGLEALRSGGGGRGQR